MAAPTDDFLEQVNADIGIAHKVCRLYFNDPDDREDALQEMMYQLWRAYPSFRGDSKFSTWMYSVCLKTALTYTRKNRSRQSERLAEHHHQIADNGTERNEDTMAMLFAAIGNLQPLNKAIILLYLEKMSYDEIASLTGLTKTNVSVRLVRIKKELELALKNQLKSIEDVNL